MVNEVSVRFKCPWSYTQKKNARMATDVIDSTGNSLNSKQQPQNFKEALSNALRVSELLVDHEPKEYQLEVLEHFFHERDSIALLRTGYGKSFIYQISPFLYAAKQKEITMISEVKFITIIISPLNSIMKDQVHSLCCRGIPACYLDMCLKSGRTYVLRSDAQSDSEESSGEEGDHGDDEMLQITVSLDSIRKGAYPLVYSHPEALLSTSKGRKVLHAIGPKVCCIAVDEAHMIQEWGESFRKDFGRIKQIVVQAKNATVMLLTATASPETRKILIESLELNNPIFVIGNPDRPNIKYTIHHRGPSAKQHDYLELRLKELADELIETRRNFPLTIVYTDFDTIIYAIAYMHAALSSDVKYDKDEEIPENLLFNQYHVASTKLSQENIIIELSKEKPRLRLIFATVALGMGLDAKHVRRVVHFKPPTSLERYMQESGRAGRDGDPANSILYYNQTDIRKNRPGIKPSIINYCLNVERSCMRDRILKQLGASTCARGDHGLCTCCCICEPICKCDNCQIQRLTEDL